MVNEMSLGMGSCVRESLGFTSRLLGMPGLLASWEFLKGAQYQTWNSTTTLSFLPDISGNGFHLNQGNLLYQPLYDGVNGINFINNTWLECLAPMGFLSGASGFSVVAKLIPGTGASDKTLIGVSQSSSSTRHRLRCSISGTSSNRLRLNCKPQALNTADVSQVGTTGLTTGSLQTITITYDGSSDTVNFYRGSTLDKSTASALGGTGTIPTVDNTSGFNYPAHPITFHVGADGSLSSGGIPAGFLSPSGDGYLQELHIFNTVLTGGIVL
jgi:hypothetical protein